MWQHAWSRLLRFVVAAAIHYKANTTLAILDLGSNKVGSEGARGTRRSCEGNGFDVWFGIARAKFPQMLLRGQALRAGVSELLNEGNTLKRSLGIDVLRDPVGSGSVPKS